MANNKIIYLDDYHAKMREYSREFLKRKKIIREIGKGKRPLRDISPTFIKAVQPDHTQFKGTDEAAMCSRFGCGRKLTSIESLAGNKCVHCMGKDKTIIHG